MKRLAWLLLLGMSFPPVGQAEGIYKCTGGRDVAYQNFPCAQGEQEMLPVSSREPYAPTQNVKPAGYAPLPQSAPVPVQDPRPTMPFKRTALALGMTDDEVLNLPHWGVPAKIVRSKLNHVWREEWLYGSKRLYFENTRLTAIEDESTSLQQVATLTAR